MTDIERYLIIPRTTKLLETHSIDEAIENGEKLLDEYWKDWDKYSSDCLGHAIKFNQLQLLYLKELKRKEELNKPTMTGLEHITKERKEQIEKHGYSIEDDGRYVHGELNIVAIAILNQDPWEWPASWDINIFHNINRKESVERLAIAGAFIAAEIDRLEAIKNGAKR